MKMIKYFYILSLIICLCCAPEKDIQVVKRTWTLITIIDAYRHDGDYFLWLTWKSDYGETYCEFVPSEEKDKYAIGMKITNRDRK